MHSDRVKFEFEFIDPCLCNAWVATAVIGSGILGAGASIYGADKAASAQTDAANAALANSQNQFNTTNANLAPYRAIGSQAAGDLSTKLSDLTSPITMDETILQNTPGYQFNLTQGLKAVQNSSAARGLGTSGAALKGASTFATGLADSTYQNQFNNANTNQTNAYNRLAGLVNTGENAGAQTGVLGNAAVTTQNSAITGAGNAQAAASNATGSALSNLASGVGGYAAYKGIYGNTGATNANGSVSGAIGPTSVGGAPLVY